jgi:hypothetical protein
MANSTGKKYGGRQKGTPNKLTKELRSILKDVLHNEMEKVGGYLGELEPKERLEMIIKLMPYVFPKVEQVHYSSEEPMDWGVF